LSKLKIDVINIDELALLSEEEIAERISKCRSEMGKRTGDWDLKEKWEVELAYSQRELQIRQVRRKAHQEFLAQEQEQERMLAFEEQGLPEYEGNKIPRVVREMLGWN
jgi:hypothetical protein